jgi:hypothetical protein
MGFRIEIEYDDDIGTEFRTVRHCRSIRDLHRVANEAVLQMQAACTPQGDGDAKPISTRRPVVDSPQA